MQTVFILSISSDIGIDLATRYLSLGYRVIGTYRNRTSLRLLEKDKNCVLIKCDVSHPKDIISLGHRLKKDKLRWEVFISCVGQPLPVVAFFKSQFNEWANSVNINSLAQLQVLHTLYPYRNKKKSDVIFFAGGGMNGAVINFSAYTISKIMLAKMCEFLDVENKDLNIFIVGPGWTRTKIHETILKDRRTDAKKVTETKKFLKSKEGTSLRDIFDSIEWLRLQGKEIISGRNFSIVHDPWRNDTRDELVKALKNDVNMYKLRRHGNKILFKKEGIMAKKITQEKAYQLGTDHQFIESVELGPWTSYSLLHDPKHLGFVLSRYKFPAKMFDGFESAIEVGCGDAFGTPIVAQHVKKVLAIEPDARHIESNTRRLAQIKNIDFKCGTIQDLKLPKGKFDGAYSIDVIEHLDQHLNDPFVETQAQILKKDGVCIIGTPNITANNYASERSRVQHINLHSQKTLNALMAKYFKRVFMFGMNDEVLHTGYAPMCHYIFGMGVGVR